MLRPRRRQQPPPSLVLLSLRSQRGPSTVSSTSRVVVVYYYSVQSESVCYEHVRRAHFLRKRCHQILQFSPPILLVRSKPLWLEGRGRRWPRSSPKRSRQQVPSPARLLRFGEGDVLLSHAPRARLWLRVLPSHPASPNSALVFVVVVCMWRARPALIICSCGDQQCTQDWLGCRHEKDVAGGQVQDVRAMGRRPERHRVHCPLSPAPRVLASPAQAGPHQLTAVPVRCRLTSPRALPRPSCAHARVLTCRFEGVCVLTYACL